MRVRELTLIAALLVVLPGCAGPPGSTARPRPSSAHGALPTSQQRAHGALPASQQRALDRALGRYLRHRPGRAALALYDRTTGIRYAFHERAPFMLASVAKVDILLAFLLDRRGKRLTGRERRLASRMIRYSDNGSARDLYEAIGGRKGLALALRRLGVRRTRPGPGTSWGWTMSLPSDQVTVLERLTDPWGPLPPRDRRYALGLMSSVVPSQAWGVGNAVRAGEVAVKNGWLPTAMHDGRWTVNSVGRVEVRGHQLLVAVLSERSPDMRTGVDTVGRLARLAVRSLAQEKIVDVGVRRAVSRRLVAPQAFPPPWTRLGPTPRPAAPTDGRVFYAAAGAPGGGAFPTTAMGVP
ncbi:Beta-lactamase class A [Nonomuraea maritima]|uniref:Beta-lactamase class A n=1 Tax=Nonomuraea maritima TaxID=683260 RepID=A0A1G9QLV6_9ACTN|nr:serine hydrolase [Nonomuraea maritima]SDM11801.1 Beta-lactamase class A [Nonomuraea maritima]